MRQEDSEGKDEGSEDRSSRGRSRHSGICHLDLILVTKEGFNIGLRDTD